MREHWTLDPDLRYLNHGSFGAVPAVTQRVQRRLLEAAEANPMRWFRALPGRVAATREIIGEYLGVPGRDIALVPNATSGVNVALRSITTTPGQRVVVTSHVYGGVAVALRRMVVDRGCEVVVVPVALDAADDEIVSSIAEVLDADTACIVIDQITSSTAKVMPAERVADLGRRHGVPVVVDGAHAPALLDRPVTGDYWTGNLHKWPCAPRGTAVLYVAPERQSAVVPAVVSWGDPLGFPLVFATPGTTDASGWLAAPTSIDLLTTLGFAERRTELAIMLEGGAQRIADAIGGVVVDVLAPAPTMRLVSLPEGVVTDEPTAIRLGAYLAARSNTETSVTSWQGRGFLRLSAHLYNVMDDYTATAARYATVFSDPELPARVAGSVS